MSTYEDTVLATRFAALAPEPLAGDWEDVRDRAGSARKGRRFADVLQSRGRRPLVVLAAVVVVVVLGAASALAVRAILSGRGIVGLAPVGATPSTPVRGELILGFSFGHTWGDMGRFDVSVYADGRMIWQRVGDHSRPLADENRGSTGLLERRLTPEGIELVIAEVLSTGLVDHDLHFSSGEGLYFGLIDLRTRDRVVHVTWGDIGGPYSDLPRETATIEQASALVRLDERLADPASWLPASTWADPEIKAYVPSAYSVCVEGKQGIGLARVLALLPPSAEHLLGAQENTPDEYTNLVGTFHQWCSKLTNDEARALQQALDDAGVRGSKDVFGLAYGSSDPASFSPTEFSLGFNPILPDRAQTTKGDQR